MYQQQMLLQQSMAQPAPFFHYHGPGGQFVYPNAALGIANLPHLHQNIAVAPLLNMPQMQEVNPQEAIDVNNVAANAGAIDGVAENLRQPDILDLVYKAIRFSLLLMILYLYSSIERLAFIFVAVVAVFFVQRHRRNNRQEDNAARHTPPQPARQDPAQDNADGVDGGEQTVSPNQPQAPRAWSVFWSTVLSFFTSLIPDAPPPINVN